MADTAILLATCNAQGHLEELVCSLLAQTDRDFVVWYHDDGSKDATIQIMERYASLHPDVFRRIYGQPTGSAKANFMYMLREVEADYYLFCDDDDVWLPCKVAKEREAILKAEQSKKVASDPDASTSPIPAAVFCDLKVVDEKLDTISPTFFSYVDRSPHRTMLSQLLIENVAPGCSIMLNRPLRDIAVTLDISEQSSPEQSSPEQSSPEQSSPEQSSTGQSSGPSGLSLIDMHDGFVMALASAVGTIAYVDEPLILYRQTGDNEVGAIHEGFSGKLKRNITNILSGELRRSKQTFHQQAYDLARALLMVLRPDESARSFLEDFLRTEDCGKLRRIRFYRRHRIDKNSHNFWYYLWL